MLPFETIIGQYGPRSERRPSSPRDQQTHDIFHTRRRRQFKKRRNFPHGQQTHDISHTRQHLRYKKRGSPQDCLQALGRFQMYQDRLFRKRSTSQSSHQDLHPGDHILLDPAATKTLTSRKGPMVRTSACNASIKFSLNRISVPVPKIPPATATATAAGDWGAAIFEDIDQSIQDTRTNPSYHTSHLSDSSSIYSTAQRQSSGPQTTMDPRAHFSRTSTGRGYPEQMANIAPSQELSGRSTASQTATSSEGTRRDSDASSRLPSSGDTSKTSSHRNTRELGDFYDSYWRQSQQPSPQPTSSSNSTRMEEKAKEGRRQNQLEINVPTIAEVPSPLATPVPSAGIGKAM